MNIANGAGDDITINGTVEFRGTVTTIQANAVCAINSAEIKLFSTVTNNGIVNWNSGYFSFDGGSFINNKNFNAASNSYIARYAGGGSFTNSSTGIFTRLTGTGTISSQIAFTNNGTMNFNSGTFQNHLGGSVSTFTNTGTLNFTGGSFENSGNGYFNSGTTITGTGAFIQDEDTLQLNTALTIPATVSFTLYNQIINGSGSIILQDSMIWSGGYLAVPLTIQNTGTLILNGPGVVLKSTCTNNGTINWNSGDLSFDGGAVINNKNFNAAADAQLYRYPGGGSFTNSSTGIFTRLTGVLHVANDVNFTNNGVMNLKTGTFHNACCTGRFTNTGTINFSGGAIFQNSIDAFFNAGTKLTGTGTFIQDFDTMQINLALSMPSHITDSITGGIINGTGSLKINGKSVWDGGVLGLPTTVQATGTMALNGGEAVVNTTLTNNGIVSWNNGYFSFSNGKFVNNNIFNITGNNQTFQYGGGSVVNGAKGVFSKTSTGTTSFNLGGTLPFTNSGTIKGVGTYDFGTGLTNKGTFAPGNSIGILTTGAGYTNKRLQIELHDAGGVGVGNDELLVNGDAKIKDTLEVILTGIVPTGDYTILSCSGTLSGKFGTLHAPAGFTTKNSGKNLILHVPLPGVSINDTSIVELNSGSKLMKFIARLPFPSNLATSVDYQTHDSSAKAPKDYLAASGTLNFGPGATSDTISVSVKGDTTTESDELFYVKLLNPVNLTLAKDTGIGSIINDDGVMPVAVQVRAERRRRVSCIECIDDTKHASAQPGLENNWFGAN
jgi:hypothetical protein